MNRMIADGQKNRKIVVLNTASINLMLLGVFSSKTNAAFHNDTFPFFLHFYETLDHAFVVPGSILHNSGRHKIWQSLNEDPSMT